MSLVPALGATAAKAPVDFDTEFGLALVAYRWGRLADAEEGLRRCLALDADDTTEAQRRRAATRLSLLLEEAGDREGALEWAARAVEWADHGTLHRFLTDPRTAGLCADPRFAAVRDGLDEARERALRKTRDDADAERRVLAEIRARHDASVIQWADGHSGPVTSLAFSPDGDRLVSGGNDRTVRLWHTRIDEPPRTIGIFGLRALVLTFSRDGSLLLVVDPDSRAAMLFDGRSGDPYFDFGGDAPFLEDAELVADGRAWTIDLRGDVRIWDVDRGEVVRAFSPEAPISLVWSSPDGTKILAQGVDGVTRLHDGRTGTLLRRVGPAGIPVESSGFLSDGRIRLRCADWRSYVYDVDGTGDPLVFPGQPGSGVSWFSFDGTRLMKQGVPDELVLWDTRNGEKAATLLTSDQQLRRVARAGDVVVAAWGQTAQNIRVWDAATARHLGDLLTSTSCSKLIGSPDGRLAIASWNGIFFADADGRGRMLRSHAARAQALDLGPGSMAASGIDGYVPNQAPPGPWSPDFELCFANGVRLWSLETGRRAGKIDGYKDCHSVLFASGGEELAIATSGSRTVQRADGTVDLWPRGAKVVRASPDDSSFVFTNQQPSASVATIMGEGGEQLGAIRGLAPGGSQEDICPAIFSPDGNFVVAALNGGDIGVFASYDASPVERLRGHTANVVHTAFDPTGTRLASGGVDETARIWDFETMEPIAPLEGHRGRIWRCAFDATGSTLATASGDGTVRLWSVEDGRELAVLEGHSGGVRWVGFQPGTGRVLSAGFDGTARLWDPVSGEQVAILIGHTGVIKDVRFLPDGRVVTRGEDATFRVWDGADGRLLVTHVEYDEDGWLTFEPGGRYVAGGGAEEWARVRVRDQEFPLSSYAARLLDPAAIEAALAGEELPPLPRLPKAPTVETTVAESGTLEDAMLEFSVLIKDPRGIADVLVERDGEVWAQGMDLEGLKPSADGRSASLELAIPVAPNRSRIQVRVRATNDRDIVSVPLVIERDYVPPSGDLFLITIAVQDYDDDTLDLASPTQDADAIAARFMEEAGDLYETVHHWPLREREVSRFTLDRLLQRLVGDVGEEDTVVVFVAGHGVQDRLGRYYFLTHDATPSDPIPGIPGSQLEDLVMWRDLAARRRVLLIDTCEAGDTSSRGIDDAFTQAEVDDFAGSGLYIVSGSSEFGAARETADNGVFTRALLDGLAGGADEQGNKNGTIDIEELVFFARLQVEAEDGPQRVTTPDARKADPFPIARAR